MTLFFLILLAVCLTIFAFQRFQRKQKPIIKPSLPKIKAEPVMESKPEKTPELAKRQVSQAPTPAPVSLPAGQEPRLLASKDPEPPGNLPTE
ncbi:MAG: hypothetical protein Q8N16_01010 [bacterium]|nr:hypothetical protein [bacterium]